MQRNLQIGVIGSASTAEQPTQSIAAAQRIGELLAKNNAALLFGAEKDCDTLPTLAAVQARKIGGHTIGITYGSSQEIFNPESASTLIVSGLERGGGREAVLCFSSDAIISIGGGAGTLAELAIAYQYNKPLVSLAGSGGWSDKLRDQFLDHRERVRITSAETPEEAVQRALALAAEFNRQNT